MPDFDNACAFADLEARIIALAQQSLRGDGRQSQGIAGLRLFVLYCGVRAFADAPTQPNWFKLYHKLVGARFLHLVDDVTVTINGSEVDIEDYLDAVNNDSTANAAVNALIVSAIAYRLGFGPNGDDNHDEHSVTLALMKFLYETRRGELGFDFTEVAAAAAAAAAGAGGAGGGNFEFRPNIHIQPPIVHVAAPNIHVPPPAPYVPDPAEVARKNNIETAKRLFQGPPDNPNLDDDKMMSALRKNKHRPDVMNKSQEQRRFYDILVTIGPHSRFTQFMDSSNSTPYFNYMAFLSQDTATNNGYIEALNQARIREPMDAWIAGAAGRTKDQWLAHTLVQCSTGPAPGVQDGTYTQAGNHWIILDGAGTRAAANRVLWPIVAPPETYFAAWTTYFAKLFSLFLASYEGQEGAAESDGEVRLPLNQQTHEYQMLFGADRFVYLPGYQSLLYGYWCQVKYTTANTDTQGLRFYAKLYEETKQKDPCLSACVACVSLTELLAIVDKMKFFGPTTRFTTIQLYCDWILRIKMHGNFEHHLQNDYTTVMGELIRFAREIDPFISATTRDIANTLQLTVNLPGPGFVFPFDQPITTMCEKLTHLHQRCMTGGDALSLEQVIPVDYNTENSAHAIQHSHFTGQHLNLGDSLSAPEADAHEAYVMEKYNINLECTPKDEEGGYPYPPSSVLNSMTEKNAFLISSIAYIYGTIEQELGAATRSDLEFNIEQAYVGKDDAARKQLGWDTGNSPKLGTKKSEPMWRKGSFYQNKTLNGEITRDDAIKRAKFTHKAVKKNLGTSRYNGMARTAIKARMDSQKPKSDNRVYDAGANYRLPNRKESTDHGHIVPRNSPAQQAPAGKFNRQAKGSTIPVTKDKLSVYGKVLTDIGTQLSASVNTDRSKQGRQIIGIAKKLQQASKQDNVHVLTDIAHSIMEMVHTASSGVTDSAVATQPAVRLDDQPLGAPNSQPAAQLDASDSDDEQDESDHDHTHTTLQGEIDDHYLSNFESPSHFKHTADIRAYLHSDLTPEQQADSISQSEKQLDEAHDRFMEHLNR